MLLMLLLIYIHYSQYAIIKFGNNISLLTKTELIDIIK